MKKLIVAALLACSAASPAYAQSFAAFGDFGNRVGATKVAALVKSKNPDHILALGDQCYESYPFAAQLDKYSAWTTTKRLWPALGNHEYSDPCGGGSARAYFNYFTLPNNERYYDVVIGNVHYFSINSNGPITANKREPDGVSVTSKQAMWLKDKLARSTSPWKVVGMHYPPHSSGEHGSTPKMQWPYKLWGADVVLAGHDHNYERFAKEMPYFVSGLGGAEQRGYRIVRPGSVVKYNSSFGALFFTATPTALDFQFVNTENQVIDTLKLVK